MIENLRNIAIIAHVDHGKTTLVDKLLQQSGTFDARTEAQERVMDSNDLEKERGITILAKNTAIKWNDYRINIVDTPGHADFGGEVERVMSMVDSVLLVVDAFDGPMPQTRFVTKKAFAHGLKPIVVINKVDRPGARPDWVINQTFDLFDKLGATEEQLDFPVIYASALNGFAGFTDDAEELKKIGNMKAIFDTILEKVPVRDDDPDGPLQMQISSLDYSSYVGKIGIGRIKRGRIKPLQEVLIMNGPDSEPKRAKVNQVLKFQGLERKLVDEAEAGDIVLINGIEEIGIGTTLTDVNHPDALPLLHVDEPTLTMNFHVNTSPLAGKEGKFVTSRQIRERLERELKSNVAMRMKPTDNEGVFEVAGRGELHLTILIENMRREGFELEVSKPSVIIKEVDGIKMEPYEDLQIEVPEESVGSVIEKLGLRGAKMENMENFENQTRLNYTIPSRGLIGFSTEFMTLTKGYGIMNHTFKEYAPYEAVDIGERKLGVLVSIDSGSATAYSIGNLEDRGIMFIEPGTEVYEGMVIGECNRDNDLAVNVTKGKNLTNVRAAGSDHTVVLKRPRPISLEYALDYINSDELVEVTPNFIRIRKRILDTESRKKFDAKKKNS